MSHYEERLERDLEHIRENIGEIASLVETALQDSVRALLEGDVQLANMTVLRDNRINRLSRRIDRECHEFIARHLPGAGHLRWISSVIRLNVAVERVGDYAVTISRESLQLSSPPKGNLPRDLARLADESRQLLHQAVRAFIDGDGDKAAAAIPTTERIEDMMDDIYGDLVDATEGSSAHEAIATFVVFSLLKRVADQAKNICEQTVFAVAGKRKKTKRFNILFVDAGNNERSLIGHGIGRKNYPDVGIFHCAAQEPAAEPDAATLAFLDSCGVETEDLGVNKLSTEQYGLQNVDILISLQGPVSQHITDVPFHTTALTWDVDAALADAAAEDAEARHQTLYRYLTEQLDGLMELISGRRSSS